MKKPEPCPKCGKRFPTEIIKSGEAIKNPPLCTVFLYTITCVRHKNGFYFDIEDIPYHFGARS